MTVDIAAFRGLFPDDPVQVMVMELTSSIDGGILFTGIEKITQDILMRLFTISGSQQFNPDYGCQFMLDAQLGRWRTIADVIQSFNLSRSDIIQQLQAIQLPTDPLDEQYQSMTLQSVTLNGDKVLIQVQIISQAGEMFISLTPFSVNIL